jgi:hypothetical protein
LVWGLTAATSFVLMLSRAADKATGPISCVDGVRLLPQYPQNLASVRTGRRQFGQIVGMLTSPHSKGH